MLAIVCCALLCVSGALRVSAPFRVAAPQARRRRGRALSSVQPSVWGPAPIAVTRGYEYWLDVRGAEVTFAQQAVLQLFYAVDEEGLRLPKGAGVQGILYAEETFDAADAVGSALPCYVALRGGGFARAESRDTTALPDAFVQSVSSELEMQAARSGAGDFNVARTSETMVQPRVAIGAVSDFTSAETTAIALPPDARLWAQALTNFRLPLTIDLGDRRRLSE
ncbi:hypothetical protein M885DRAFT_494983 [Pelagophyceae sp. CCMP2097]|nr:hypothetical protein M885DRAFT_494983 [Pelagophyceae sp. CCMP2097]